jgi:Mg-chelatase subunit ChlD
VRTIHWLVSAAAAVSAIAVASGGCAESSSTDDGDSSSTGGSGTSLAASGGAGGGVGTGGVGGGELCVLTTKKAEKVALDLIVALDRSASMQEFDKWGGTTEALIDFLKAPTSAGMGVGLLLFPTMTLNDKCMSDTYKHLDVPIVPLPDNRFDLTNTFPDNATGSGTPLLPVLEGALQVATAHQDANPKHKVSVVLATDGDPCCCPDLGWGPGDPPPDVEEIIDDMAHVAESARNYNGVRTFVIGVQGATLPHLDEVAKAGGTGKAYDVTTAINELEQTLEEIRQESLGCEFALPPPPDGEVLVPNEVGPASRSPCRAPTTSATAAMLPAGITTTTRRRRRSCFAPRLARSSRTTTKLQLQRHSGAHRS